MRFMPPPSRASSLLLAALAACATAPSGPPARWTNMPAEAPPQGEFQAVGEILCAGGGAGRSAAYSLFRVAGPTANITYTGNGTWTGSIDGRNVSLTTSPGRLTGASIDLYVYQDGDALTIRGTWFQREVWVTLTPDRLQGHTAAQGGGFDFARKGPGLMSGAWGIRGQGYVEFRGEAAQYPNVVGPQFHLALLAALP